MRNEGHKRSTRTRPNKAPISAGRARKVEHAIPTVSARSDRAREYTGGCRSMQGPGRHCLGRWTGQRRRSPDTSWSAARGTTLSTATRAMTSDRAWPGVGPQLLHANHNGGWDLTGRGRDRHEQRGSHRACCQRRILTHRNADVTPAVASPGCGESSRSGRHAWSGASRRRGGFAVVGRESPGVGSWPREPLGRQVAECSHQFVDREARRPSNSSLLPNPF